MESPFSLPEPPEICFPVTDESGEVIARVRGNPDMDEKSMGHLREIIKAAKRHHESMPPTGRTVQNVQRRNRSIE